MSIADSKHTLTLELLARRPSGPRRMLLHKKMLQRLQCNAGEMSRPRILLHDLVMKQGPAGAELLVAGHNASLGR